MNGYYDYGRFTRLPYTALQNRMLATTALLKEGRYSIEQELNDADNCVRFQAFDTVNETAVTIVEIPVRLPKVATAAQREALNVSFETQASALEKFSHNSAIAIRDHFSEGGRHYVVTDLVDGMDLASLLASLKRPFPLSDVVEWADKVLEVLNALHSFRPPTFYKALRPENLVQRADRSVAMLMSAAVLCGEQSSSDDSVAYSPLEQLWTGLDAASQKVIINKYDEASERILKQDLDARCDIYSLGATLYHLVTARRPIDVLERSIEMIEGNPDPLKSPHKVDPSIPHEISDVIMKAMEIKREYRFDSAAIMRQVLKTALVRVKEREAEEAREHEEAAADIQRAKQEREANADNNGEAPEHSEAVMAELREAEERRLEAERHAAAEVAKAAETAKVEAAKEPQVTVRPTESFKLAELDDDLLGLLSPSSHTSDAPDLKANLVHNSKAPETPDVPDVIVQPFIQEVEQPAVSAETVEVAEAFAEVKATVPEEASVDFGPAVVQTFEETVPTVDESFEPADDSMPAADEVDLVEVVDVAEEFSTLEAVSVSEEPVSEAEEITTAVDEPDVSAAAIDAVDTTPVLVDEKPATASVPTKVQPKIEAYDYPEPARNGLPIPALAAAGTLLLVVAIGGWFFLGSSSSSATETPKAETQTTVPAQSSQANDPARNSYQESPQNQQEQVTQQQAQNVPPGTSETRQEPQRAASATTAQPKQQQKKPAPAPTKAPAQKKPVTVDDLINDN